jgi:hypothetical protein
MFVFEHVCLDDGRASPLSTLSRLRVFSLEALFLFVRHGGIGTLDRTLKGLVAGSD